MGYSTTNSHYEEEKVNHFEHFETENLFFEFLNMVFYLNAKTQWRKVQALFAI
ncbi:MAG: hypothetical protein PWQ17_1545 [Anaerophaga sp.]|nr:hypothetical protein [Anaerophaga sp.]MDN5291209.1 hypothetical protein [Anaerophaga sp.]